MAVPEHLLIVTTRSRLRHIRFFPVMLLASRRIRRQLEDTDGLVRAASIVAGPREFWTVTVWRSRHAMQEFMRSGVHGQIMWRFSRWLRSFWLMRWTPGAHEVGVLDGVALAAGRAPTTVAATPHPQVAPDGVLDGIPSLRSAIGADGRISHHNAAAARRQRGLVQHVGGAIIRLRVPLRRLPGAFLAVRRLLRDLRLDPDVVRAAMGVGRPGEIYLLTVWRDRAAAGRLLSGDWSHKAAQTWRQGYWANVLLPESEFGHWDGMRLRRQRARRAEPTRTDAAGSARA